MNATALLLLLLLSAAEAGGCTEELISFSSCLAYVSYPPNNLTESASDKCCNAFSSAVESLCLCYLLRDPLILGFPLNTTRLLSLSSICPTSTSFNFLCSVSPALPPLNSVPTQPQRRGGGGRKGGSSGKTVPIVAGGRRTAGTTFYYSLLFSQFLAILVTLLNTLPF